jgi:cytochrome c oxidase assembly protein subunit 11
LRSNRLLPGVLVAVPLVMVALSFAAVPLYRKFCEATGFGGTTQRASRNADRVLARTIEIRFNADTDRGLPWSFRPNQRSLTLKIGETGLATFRAHNDSSGTLVGTAVYNVTPEKAGLYFDKIQCFCFTQQKLAAGETADLPVAFFVDPAIADDRNLDDVSVITLSYTFYKAQDQASAENAAAKSPKDAGPGAGALAAGRPVE